MKNYIKQTTFFIGLIIIILASCNKENLKQGTFEMQQITYLKNGTEQLQETSTNFNLGELYASKEFYFMLSNAGDYPITNINIVSNNEQFTVSPSQIDTLSAANQSSFSQAITLGILHGKVLNGVGTAPTLQQGENYATLTITGTTYDGREYVDVSFEVQIDIVAKVADISVFASAGEVDMTNYCGRRLGVEIGEYIFCTPSTEFITLKNTGNVSLEVNIKYTDTINWLEYVYIDTVLNPTNTYTINNNSLSEVGVIFSGENTVVKKEKFITTDNDGLNYFVVKVNN